MRGATAGAIAAAAWAAAEPALGRAFETPFSDVRLLGRLATRGRGWPVAGVGMHVANGAVFGWAFEQARLGGPLKGVVAAEAENAVLWPTMLVADRIHPDRRNGVWPALFRSRRVALYEITTHALFGLVLGALVPARRA